MWPLPLASSLSVCSGAIHVLVWPLFILFSYNGITVHRNCTEIPASILQMIKVRPLHHGSPYLAIGKQLFFLFSEQPLFKKLEKLIDLFSSAGFSRIHNLSTLHFPAWDTYLRTEMINQ